MSEPAGGGDFTRMVDLASRRLGAGVVAANDELFAERENLIKPEPPVYRPLTFGHKGQIYDGWETRRRRVPGSDWAMVRLGAPGIVHGVVVDTAFFTGNYPPEVSVEGAAVDGYPSPDELQEAEWLPLVPRSPVLGDSVNPFAVTSDRRVTHVRLSIYPDGGVARLRVHGEVVPDPRFLLPGAVDLAALTNGATISGCSNMFYSSPTNLIAPGEPQRMSDGWETARRRDDGNDWVEIELAGPGVVRLLEIDTRHFVGNAPGWAAVSGILADSQVAGNGGGRSDGDRRCELLPRQRLQPDTMHRFVLAEQPAVSHVRVDVYPDGGLGRVRLWGDLSEVGRYRLEARWRDSAIGQPPAV